MYGKIQFLVRNTKYTKNFEKYFACKCQINTDYNETFINKQE